MGFANDRTRGLASERGKPDEQERARAIESVIGQIEKQHGKGSVMRLGDDVRPPIEVIPTGSIALDVALGIGGLPRGRVVEIYGPESSGKCLTADTYVWTDRGLETVAEVFARAGTAATCTSRVTDVRELGMRVVNERGELEPVAALTHNNRKPTVRIVTRSGRSVTATHNHPLRVVSERGFVVWRNAGDVKAGDTVVSALFGAEEASCGESLSGDEAVRLGHQIAEASIEGSQTGVPQTGLPVTVPHQLRTAGAKAQRALLSALFDSASFDPALSDAALTDPPRAVGLRTSSAELARQVQLLLGGLGIPATLRGVDDQLPGHGPYSVLVDPSAAPTFQDTVGFGSQQTPATGQALDDDSRPEHIASTGPAYTYEEVLVVQDAGLQPTFDLMVPQTHSFIANGVLSHNTTVALHAVANAQKGGGIAAFIDAEHALDPEYAKSLGVDTDALLVSQPDTGEQALEIADMLIRSGALDIIVIDSVAALVPRAEIEGEMGDSHVGLQARLMSQALRKLTGALSTTGTTAIFINQLREKIGVMFGCFSYGTRVTLADGTSEKIGRIVNQRLPVEVSTYDPVSGHIVARPVTGWFDNGVTEQFLQFTVERSGGNGRSQFAATPNHQIRTPGGWRPAGEIVPGDRVMMQETARLSDQQWQVVLGGLMGDGHLAPNLRGRRGVRFRMGHGAKQVAYLEWKAGLLGNIPQCLTRRPNGAVHVDLTPLPELSELREVVYWGDGKKHFGEEFFKALTPLALAIWFMDDGSFTLRSKGLQQRTVGGSGRIEFCVEAMSPATQGRLVDYLRDEHGVDSRLSVRGARGKAYLQLTTRSTERFQELIAPYVHRSMEYKLLGRFRGAPEVMPEFAKPRRVLVPARVQGVHVKPRTRSMHRFDIEVEGTHNYFVDGVMVHNSPETTTGGKALKFYASVRLDVRRIETLKDGSEAVGNRTRVKVVKNKVSPPFKQAEFDIIYGQGISREGGLIDMGVDHGFVRKAGAWYTYEGDQLGQGKENARAFLRDNPDLADEIEKRIKEKLGVGPKVDQPAVTDVPVDF